MSVFDMNELMILGDRFWIWRCTRTAVEWFSESWSTVQLSRWSRSWKNCSSTRNTSSTTSTETTSSSTYWSREWPTTSRGSSTNCAERWWSSASTSSPGRCYGLLFYFIIINK